MFVQLGLRLRTHKLVATFTTYLNPILMGNPKKLLDLTRIGSLLKWGLDKVRKNDYRKVIKESQIQLDCQYEVKEIVVVYNNYKLENADQVGNPVNRNLQYTDQEYKKLWNICLDIIVQLG